MLKRWSVFRAHPAVDLVVTLATAILIAYLVQLWLVKPYQIPSESMDPSLLKGDRILVVRFLYHFKKPARGDIIVFHPNGKGDDVFPTSKSASTTYYVKRLIGLPGDVVGSHAGKLYICSDGRFPDDPGNPEATRGCAYLNESYTHGQQTGTCGESGADLAAQKVQTGQYLMLGDNREHSNDGRCWGQIRESQLIGRAFANYWPLTRITVY